MSTSLNIEKIRASFPLLGRDVYGKPLVYLDNGATTQKPQVVIDAIKDYYEQYNSNVHRGVHYLSQVATDAQELARSTVAQFINAAHAHEVIFTKGTTDSINLAAYAYCKQFIQPGDEILVSQMEHHSNIVPWQIACEDRGGILKVIPITEAGELDMEAYAALLQPRTKLVAVTWVSNTLGTVNPVKTIIEKAHQLGIPVLLDAAQAIQHIPVDVQELDVDFLVFSGHKIYGPTGIGALYGKEKWLNEMPPYQGGGSMIKTVTFDKTTYAALPFKFEAGTPHVAGIVGLGAAIRFVNDIGIEAIMDAEQALLHYAQEQLSSIEGLRFVGSAAEKAGALSVMVNDIHPFDLGELLDKQGIAVRTGHHCCQPIMDFYGIPGTLRASFALYNNKEDVRRLVQGIERGKQMLS